ncbi:unnamed protein product [Brachionus calyciflorus]|uniref:Lysosome-associated membrane glycoprotein 5 n=1 Tax=Brachionus calyciflorus TaxID=104777 RepID=A0A813ZEP9_9BILA|nr:unnamed protein product [Brachionus calyciflorus]
MRFKNFLVLGLALCLANFVICEDDTTTAPETTTESTTTLSPDTTTESTTTTTTTEETTTPTTTTSSSTTTPEETTTPTTTTSSSTTTPETTTVTTTTVVTTTTGPENNVLNFTVYQTNSTQACLRAKFSLAFNIMYPAIKSGVPSNETTKVAVNSYDSYTGECSDTFNTLSIEFLNGWTLILNYTLEKNAYELSMVRLVYRVKAELFPDVDPSYVGEKRTERSDLKEFAANKGNSFKCTSETKLDLEPVQVDFKNYQAQPFLDSKTVEFDTAIECAADSSGTSKLVPIIVGSSLAVLVILVLVAYIVGRRKHRPGYQQV